MKRWLGGGGGLTRTLFNMSSFLCIMAGGRQRNVLGIELRPSGNCPQHPTHGKTAVRALALQPSSKLQFGQQSAMCVYVWGEGGEG
jgi:hypothetical protein